MERLDTGLVARISAAVSSPWSNMGALQTDVGQYVGRLRSDGVSLEHALVELRGVCRPSVEPGLVGPDSAWVHVVLARIVCWAARTYCGDSRLTEETPMHSLHDMSATRLFPSDTDADASTTTGRGRSRMRA